MTICIGTTSTVACNSANTPRAAANDRPSVLAPGSNVIAFRSATDQASREFVRTGSTAYTRTIGEAAWLYENRRRARAVPRFTARVDALAIAVARLASTRPDAVDDLVIVDDGRQQISLRFMPDLIRALAA